MKALIDNGYGENTPGKYLPDGGLEEWAYTKGTADRMVTGLRHRGEEVGRIMREDVDIPSSIWCRRVDKIYQESGGNAILIPIHCNAAAPGIDWSSAHEWGVFVSNNASVNSKRLAASLAESTIVQPVFARQLMLGQLFWTQSLAIRRDMICPSILTENFSQDNKEDVEFLLSLEGK